MLSGMSWHVFNESNIQHRQMYAQIRKLFWLSNSLERWPIKCSRNKKFVKEYSTLEIFKTNRSDSDTAHRNTPQYLSTGELRFDLEVRTLQCHTTVRTFPPCSASRLQMFWTLSLGDLSNWYVDMASPLNYCQYQSFIFWKSLQPTWHTAELLTSDFVTMFYTSPLVCPILTLFAVPYVYPPSTGRAVL